ncbi:hypothetical protein HDE_09286 [Halotydeus destructor]|nr:hypothetical protein HDE_09286 [Halotydeus destructor]
MNSSTSSCNLDRVRVKYRDKMSSDMTPAVVEFGRLTKMDLESNAIPRKLLWASCEPTKPTSLDETSELFSKRSKNHDDEANIEVLAALTFTKEYSFTSNRVLVIDFMAVSENKQGKGLGSYLIKKLTSPSIGGPFSCVKAKVCRRNRSAIDFFRKNGFISDQILSLKYNCEKSNLRFKKYEPIERMQYSETVLELFLLPPIVPKTNRDHLGNILTMKTLDADIDSWRVKSLDAYQEEICLVLKMKKEIRRLTSMIKEKNDEIHYLKRENSQLKTVVDCTNPFAAISAIDQIDVMFSNLKDVYNKLMID